MTLPLRLVAVTNMYPTVTTPAEGTFVADQVESLRAIGVEVTLMHLTRTARGRGVYRSLAKDSRRLVAHSEPDVVHVMYGGVMADIITRAIADRPVLVSFCGTDLLGGGQTKAATRLRREYGALASRRAARRAAGAIVKSRNLFEALPPDVDRGRVWIVPNGIDLELFRPQDRAACRARLGWEADRRHVLFPSPPGRPEKRFALAQAAVRALAEEGVESDLHPLVDVPHEEVPLWLNAADVVLLTSTHEGSPNAVKEALACNVPIVSVEVGDVRERIDGVEGCHCAAATPPELAAKLAEVLERGERVRGREQVLELSLPTVARRLRAIYEMLAAER
jgi:glycosyltransferase involved in cell wall biosynthesis